MSDQEREYRQDDLRSAAAEVQAAEAELAAAQARLDAARARAQAAAQADGQQAPSYYTTFSQPFGSAPYQQAGSQSGTQPGAQHTGQQASSYYTYQATYYGQPSQNTYQGSYPNNYQDPYRQGSQPQSFQSYMGLSTKDHVAAGLLGIFIGALGIHKFYLGYNSTGFIVLAVTVLGGLLTFGLASAVMAVIALIEGIIYLVKSQTDFEHIYVLNKREWF